MGFKNRSTSSIALGCAHVSRHLSRRLPYYLLPEEAHQLIDAAKSEFAEQKRCL